MSAKEVGSKYLDTAKKELLIIGYIRQLEQSLLLSYRIPEGIAQIIISHYQIAIFKFKTLNGITVSEDGLTLKCEDWVYHSIRFGEFLHKNEKIIFEVIFHLKQANPGCIAIGFMTPEFDEKLDPKSGLNYGHNHSCCLTGNNFFATSPNDFVPDKWYKEGDNSWFRDLWKDGDTLHVEIDMIVQKGRMWNDDDKEKQNMVEIGLPDSAAMFVDTGDLELEIIAVHQEFRCKNQN